ncbi:hypothetical protein B0O99DRAFT_537622 [Bisporella sp. PMI_857]|nr:hypothetical protein B0O99DRAFT_537622 [Bisporella sp. PMI_857]
MRFHTRRLGVFVCLTVVLWLFISFLLLVGRVRLQLQRIDVPGRIRDWWQCHDEITDEEGVRVVVFGDSWVDDTVQDGESGRGKSWVEIFCDKIDCSSHYNFASTQLSKAFPQSPQTGAITSNRIYTNTSSTQPKTASSKLLPDLATQINQYVALSKSSKPTETIFVVSFGFWDIYHFASLDISSGKEVIDDTITELFKQLDDLYVHYSSDLATSGAPSPLRIIIPKLVDPTLFPGWISRPVPLTPSSVAEEQKNAVYLTTHWNAMLEKGMETWIRDLNVVFSQFSDEEIEEAKSQNETVPIVEKDVFYYDLPRHLLNLLIEHRFEEEDASDATGFGNKQSPFLSTEVPCFGDSSESLDGVEEMTELHGRFMCKKPHHYMFWDAWRVGRVVSEEIGKGVAKMVKKGKSMRKIWEEGMPKGDL